MHTYFKIVFYFFIFIKNLTALTIVRNILNFNLKNLKIILDSVFLICSNLL